MGFIDNLNNLYSSFKTVIKPDIFSIDSTTNEVVISENTVKGITAYSAGVNSIANSIASIPFKLRHNKEYVNNDLNYIIKERPNRHQTPFDFKRRMINDMLYRGTSFAIIQRDQTTGEVEEIIPIDYDAVSDARYLEGELYYTIKNIPYHSDDLLIFKITGNGAFGIDPLTIFADTLGVSLSSTRYTKKTFEGDGSNIKGIITSQNKLKEEQKKEFRDSIQANYTGSNSKSLLVLDAGFDFKPVSFSPDQIKLIETRNIQVAEVARILGVPIQIIASETPSNYNSTEAQMLDFYKRTLAPIVYMIEQELKTKLLTKAQIKDGYYFKGSIESLLRGDSQSRAQYYKELFYLGSITPEEIRNLEDMPEELNGDTYIQTNLIPSKLINDFYESKIDSENNKRDII